MPIIKDLVTFKEIKDVIDIDSDVDTVQDKKSIVSEFIISDRLKEHLIHIANNLSKPTHKSLQIIGGYGSGKSHLLAWIVSLLENPELVTEITDSEIKDEYKKTLSREFAVVQFELQPGKSSLSEYFFQRVRKQLMEKHGIEIPIFDTSDAPDYKDLVHEIVKIVKEKNPKMGLVVIIDEISDFLKQKNQTQKEGDNQFLRILGQVSQKTDFIFIGSMQENVFTSEKYIDNAESFGRVSQRFDIITISSEDIKKVISQRVLKKNTSQFKSINDLLADYKKIFQPINSNPDEYIDLFPVHPYVIKLFSEMEYFEKRGVIQFTMERVRDILEEEFPHFITYDNVYDEINSKHTIRNLDEVHPVIEIIDTLHSKIDLVEPRFQEDAKKLVKALAVLKLYGKTTKNGATPEELANHLLITSTNVMKNTDRIVIILNKIREVTSGQFIGKGENDYYYLTLEEGPDYDVVVERRTKNLPEGILDEELLEVLRYADLIDSGESKSYARAFKDSCEWANKKSFRLGHFVFDDGTEYVKKGNLDFNLVIKSPYNRNPKISSSKDTAVIQLEYDEEIDDLLRKLAATRLLVNENYAKGVMQKKRSKLLLALKERLLSSILNSEIEYSGSKKRIKTVLDQQPDTIDEFFHNIKGSIFNEYFSSEYPNYPKFQIRLSHENIKGEVDSTLGELLRKGEKNLFSSAKSILSSLGLIDIDCNIDITASLFARVIVGELEKNKGMNVKIEDIVGKLSSKPFGLEREMTLLIISVLTYSGEVTLKKKGGGVVTASDLQDVLKKGVEEFKDIPYATLETDFPVEAASRLFRVLGLNQGLVRNSKDRTKAVQEFRTKSLEIKEALESIDREINQIKTEKNPILNLEIFSDRAKKIQDIPINDFLIVKTVSDFKKVQYSEHEINDISESVNVMLVFSDFLKDYNGFIKKDIQYMINAIDLMEINLSFFPESERNHLRKISTDCIESVKNMDELLDSEKRRILKGSLEQFKRNYSEQYFSIHTKTIGEGINWETLSSVSKSMELRKLRDMSAIRVVNSIDLKKLEDRILKLSSCRCTNLREEHLKMSHYCTWCSFPSNLSGISDINIEITKIFQDLHAILEVWTYQILDEIENYRDNIPLLSQNEQALIKKMLEDKTLPDEIDQEMIGALNSLFSELTEIQISPQSILDYIFTDMAVLDFDSFSKNLDNYKEEILSKGARKNIRIMRKEE